MLVTVTGDPGKESKGKLMGQIVLNGFDDCLQRAGKGVIDRSGDLACLSGGKAHGVVHPQQFPLNVSPRRNSLRKPGEIVGQAVSRPSSFAFTRVLSACPERWFPIGFLWCSGNHVIRGHGPAGYTLGIDDLGTETLLSQGFHIGLQGVWTLSHSRTGAIMT